MGHYELLAKALVCLGVGDTYSMYPGSSTVDTPKDVLIVPVFNSCFLIPLGRLHCVSLYIYRYPPLSDGFVF